MGSRSRSASLDAFLVLKRGAGDERQIPSNSPAGAVAVINRWLRQDPQASLSWLVNENLPEPIVMSGRLQGHLKIGLDQKRTHLFVCQPGEQVGPKLTSRCGLTFDWWALEFAEALDTPMGAPCEQCELLMMGPVPEHQKPALPSAQSEDDGWDGWLRYYTELDWPVIEHGGQLLLDAVTTSDVVVLTVPVDLARQVQDDLAEREMQAPLLYLPSMPDEALFVVSRTPVPVPMPPAVQRLGAAVPLPPSVVADHEGEFYLEWGVSPGDAVFGSSNDLRCRDIDVVAAIYKVHHQQQLEQRQQRAITS
ncbi:hypothetical protein JNUCC0626_50050 (plasmid) [Lentzea sp. JNUCC 0626]|uniref:hypothetical protein n=1 Tax=Lentzea sp. JNUCC 0626 TaxID=3367513 RepID=UPI003749EAF9